MGDQEKIQGTWALVSGERNGKPLPDQVIQHIKLTFAGDKLTTQHKDRETDATFKLDSNKTPKEIDFNMDGNVGEGIYQLDGDSLRIVHGEVGDARPKDFPKAGSGLTVLVLKREKSLNEDPKENAVKADMKALQGSWTVVSIEVSGTKVPDDKIGGRDAAIKGDQYSIHDFRLAVKIDPSKRPKTIDMDGKDGNGKPLSMLGIYDIEENMLKICFAKPGTKERPTKFETRQKTGESLIVYKRRLEKK
jgi:uncharacterized protein (TIGR03067 family)